VILPTTSPTGLAAMVLDNGSAEAATPAAAVPRKVRRDKVKAVSSRDAMTGVEVEPL
jgi:hypothetical protein